MSALAILLPVAVLGALVFGALVALARGRDGLDVSARSLFRAYVYIASFAGVVALAFGAASLGTAAFAWIGGNEFVYGGIPQEIAIRRTLELDATRGQDALRGATFATLGGLFWLVHWIARNRVAPGDQGPLRHAYALVGSAIFALATIVLLPVGVYLALGFWLLPVAGGGYRQGAGMALAGGIVSAAIWLLYLRLMLDDMPRGPRWRTFSSDTRPSPPPPEGAAIGARIGPPPSGRSAGAEALPPREGR